MIDASPAPDTFRRAALLPDDYVLMKDDAAVVGQVLGGQHYSYSYVDEQGPVSWGAFGASFATMGDLRKLAAENPPAPVAEDIAPETVGLELFGNMLDTIAFLRVRLRALADVCIEKGVVSGPELLTKYHEYHGRSFEAFRDLMLLRPEIFELRFAEWLQTEKDYRERLLSDSSGQTGS